ETYGACDPNSGSRGPGLSNEPRVESFSWTGSLNRDANSTNKVTLALRFRDSNAGGNFRPLAPVTIDDLENPQLTKIAEQIVDNFVQTYQKSQYKIYVHFESEILRSSLEQKILRALTEGGYNVIGVDLPPTSVASSWIDYFFPDDCRGANEIRQTLLPILQPS